MTRVFLSLGSNWLDRVRFLREAVSRLAASPGIHVLGASPLYETEPWEGIPGAGIDEQLWYLNCVISIETSLAPPALLACIQEIETALGRTRTATTPEAQRFLPRTLDIDILFYGDRVISVPDDLHIPHLLLHEREFVLRPLADLAPDFVHPTLYRTIRELLDELPGEHEVRRADYPEKWLEA
jgi:2-amino-4-hydroxy-6-hydroxymethyldihydropteridine diphosphokinase